jgi:hypothetical protein
VVNVGVCAEALAIAQHIAKLQSHFVIIFSRNGMQFTMAYNQSLLHGSFT